MATRTIDIRSLVEQTRGGPEPEVPVYYFPSGRTYYDRKQNGVYTKPSDGSPDPDLANAYD